MNESKKDVHQGPKKGDQRVPLKEGGLPPVNQTTPMPKVKPPKVEPVQQPSQSNKPKDD